MKLHHLLLTLAASLSAIPSAHAHDIPPISITPYDLANCKSAPNHSRQKIGNATVGEATEMPYRTCVDFPLAKSYSLKQKGRNKYSPFCQLGVYYGGGCKNGFNANTALQHPGEACFDTLLPNGWLGGGEGPSWSAYYVCDV